MRKTYVLVIVLVVVIGLLSYLGISILNKTKEKNHIAKTLEVIPEFEFMDSKQTSFKNTHLKPNTNTVLIYYNSACDYCHLEAEGIYKHKDQFKNTQILFVSAEPMDSILKFANQYKLNKNPNLAFYHDTHHFFSSQLDISSVPFLLIYDKRQKLIKKHKGPINAPAILNLLKPYE